MLLLVFIVLLSGLTTRKHIVGKPLFSTSSNGVVKPFETRRKTVLPKLM